ncbi:general secretion pathway protein C [Gammaproteobacteria bacterium]
MSLSDWQPLAALHFPSNLLGRLVMPVTIFLVLALAHTLAHLTWSLWPNPVRLPPPPRPAAVQPMVSQGPNIEAITAAHLFGKVDVARPAPTLAPTPVAVPDTPLNLILRGILASTPPEGGAIIAEVGGGEHFYRVGESVPGGAVLQEVQPTQVFLARNQRLETLRLPKESRGGSNPTDTATATDPPPGAIDHSMEDPTGNNPDQDPSQTLNRYRDQVLENPASLLSLIQTQPVYRAGKLEGFRLRPGPEGGNLLERYGLKPNDLVTSLNGIPLDNPMKAAEVLRGLRNAPTLNVGVSRQGRTENVTLRFTR